MYFLLTSFFTEMSAQFYIQSCDLKTTGQFFKPLAG